MRGQIGQTVLSITLACGLKPTLARGAEAYALPTNLAPHPLQTAGLGQTSKRPDHWVEQLEQMQGELIAEQKFATRVRPGVVGVETAPLRERP